MDGRFENEENVDMYREASDAKNTKRSTNTWVNAYNEWRDSRGYVEDLHQTDPVSLNERLKLFFAQLRKKNGEHYEPNCLKVMMAALDRELRNRDCKFSLRDTTFREAVQVLNGKAKLIRQGGKGKLPNAANSISPDEEDIFWRSGHLGVSSPRTLLYTL